jgi:hypothetical protein
MNKLFNSRRVKYENGKYIEEFEEDEENILNEEYEENE